MDLGAGRRQMEAFSPSQNFAQKLISYSYRRPSRLCIICAFAYGWSVSYLKNKIDFSKKLEGKATASLDLANKLGSV